MNHLVKMSYLVKIKKTYKKLTDIQSKFNKLASGNETLQSKRRRRFRKIKAPII